jgi:lipoprotein-releasing system ATP-binding protein
VPDEGQLSFAGQVISGQSLSKLSTFRSRQIGFVFQFHHLLPEFTALENIMIPALMVGRPRSEVKAEAMAALENLGLADRARHRPSKLSGGEQQRVALARALINHPSLLMADEPTGNLDIHTGETVIKMLWDMTVRKDRGLIIVTHEPLIARKADRILRLFEGKLYPVSHAELEELMPGDA